VQWRTTSFPVPLPLLFFFVARIVFLADLLRNFVADAFIQFVIVVTDKNSYEAKGFTQLCVFGQISFPNYHSRFVKI